MSVCVSMCIHVQCTYIARLLSLTVCVCMRETRYLVQVSFFATCLLSSLDYR
jgi:hypothetical protein